MDCRTFIPIFGIIFMAISSTSGMPVALRSPIREIKAIRPWSEVRLHSDEDYNRSSGNPESGTFPGIKGKFHFPNDDNDQDSLSDIAHRNSIPDASEAGNYERKPSSDSLQRFYKHSSSSPPARGGGMIVFPNEDPFPEREITSSLDKSEGISFGTRSDDVLEINNSSSETESLTEKPISSLKDQLAVDILSGISEEEVVSDSSSDSDIISNVSPTESQSENDETELNVREQSLYTGPSLKSNEDKDSDAGCPEGMKRTRNGSCQKPSRRLMQGG